jgi:hypothetical protein
MNVIWQSRKQTDANKLNDLSFLPGEAQSSSRRIPRETGVLRASVRHTDARLRME